MQDNILLEDWLVVKLEPAAIFRPTSLDAIGMGFALSRKVADLCDALELPKATFGAWLLTLDNDVSAIFLHGAEILSDEVSPLTALLALRAKGQAGITAGIREIPLLHMGVTDWDRLFKMIMEPKSGRLLRSFLSSELCVLVKPEEYKDSVKKSNEAASVIFESDPLHDLADMIVFDVMSRIKSSKMIPDEVSIEGGKLSNLKKIDEKDFERIAINEMEKRRVVKSAREILLPKVKSAFVK